MPGTHDAVPRTATAAITCLDGYPLAQKGKAPLALFVTAINSFVGSSFAIVLVMGFAPLIAELALEFSSAEYFSVMLLGLIAASTMTAGSPFKGLAMVIFGIALGLVGTDVNTGMFRFNFGILELANKLGVRFAFPTQTIFVEEFPGNGNTTPNYDIDPANMEAKTKEQLEKWKEKFVAGGS